MTTIDFLRSFRLEGYAIFDFAVSFLGIYLLSPFLSKLFLKIGLNIPKPNWLFLTLPLSILFHLIFNKLTPLTRDFLNPGGGYILKIVVLFLFIWGIRGIKIVKK